MHPTHCTYTLTHIFKERDVNQGWKYSENQLLEVSKNCDVVLQYGSTIGMLHAIFYCACGCRNVRIYFFHLRDTDYIYKVMQLSMHHNLLQAHLPNGDTGMFQCDLKSPAFNDSYILGFAVLENEKDFADDETKRNESLNTLFSTIHTRIILRTMFNRLYFRAFRRSFAPNQPQGLKQIQALERCLPVVCKNAT